MTIRTIYPIPAGHTPVYMADDAYGRWVEMPDPHGDGDIMVYVPFGPEGEEEADEESDVVLVTRHAGIE